MKVRLGSILSKNAVSTRTYMCTVESHARREVSWIIFFVSGRLRNQVAKVTAITTLRILFRQHRSLAVFAAAVGRVRSPSMSRLLAAIHPATFALNSSTVIPVSVMGVAIGVSGRRRFHWRDRIGIWRSRRFGGAAFDGFSRSGCSRLRVASPWHPFASWQIQWHHVIPCPGETRRKQ